MALDGFYTLMNYFGKCLRVIGYGSFDCPYVCWQMMKSVFNFRLDLLGRKLQIEAFPCPVKIRMEWVGFLRALLKGSRMIVIPVGNTTTDDTVYRDALRPSSTEEY